ncbi:MAG: hypothetical protein R2848_09145 [Thermomicrobiales bacterium]
MSTNHEFPIARMMPWRLPLALIIGFLIAMSAFAVPGARAADNDTQVALTLQILSRACEIEGGTFDYHIFLNEDGTIDHIAGACSVKGSKICTIWSDGDFICVRSNPEQTVQQQVAQPQSAGSQAAMTEGPGTEAPVQSQGDTGDKVESRTTGSPPTPESTATAGR